MSKSATRLKRKTRRAKIDDEFNAPPQGELFVPVQAKTPKLEAANPRQKQFLAYLREGRQVVIAQGSAGTGKSYIAAYHAAEQLRNKKIDKILLVRANVAVGKSLGMLPGTLKEKLTPFFAQTLSHLKKFMGNHLNYCLEKDVVEMQSIEHIRGLSVEHTLVIIEEAQNLTADELEMILSRIGEGSQFVFTGDQKQNDLKGASGLIKTISMISSAIADQPEYLADEDLDCLEDSIGVVTFSPDDVVRSGLCRAFVKMYYHN